MAGVDPLSLAKDWREDGRSHYKKLLPPQELVQKIDPKLLSKALVPVFENLLEPAIEDIIESRNPRLWEFLPKAVRRQVKERAMASFAPRRRMHSR